MEIGSRTWVDIRAGGPNDPDAFHAAALSGAYFEAEQAQASRRLVWRTVAIGGLVVWALRIATSVLTRVDLAFSVALLGYAVVASGATEWRARKRLRGLLRTMCEPC